MEIALIILALYSIGLSYQNWQTRKTLKVFSQAIQTITKFAQMATDQMLETDKAVRKLEGK